MEDQGDSLLFTVSVSDYNGTEIRAYLYYSFETGDPNGGGWNIKNMSYEQGELRAKIGKKEDFSVIYYYVYVEYRNETGLHRTVSAVHEYRNSGDQKTFQIMCIVAFFIFFIAFEIIMRYPLMKRRKGKKEEKDVEKEDVGITKCPYCGKIIPENSETCPYCNAPLEKDAESKEITMGDD